MNLPRINLVPKCAGSPVRGYLPLLRIGINALNSCPPNIPRSKTDDLPIVPGDIPFTHPSPSFAQLAMARPGICFLRYIVSWHNGTKQVFFILSPWPKVGLSDYFCNLHRLCEIVEFLGVCQVEPDGVFDLKIAPSSVYTALLEAMNSSAKIITESNNKVTIQEKITNAREKTTNKATNLRRVLSLGRRPEK